MYIHIKDSVLRLLIYNPFGWLPGSLACILWFAYMPYDAGLMFYAYNFKNLMQPGIVQYHNNIWFDSENDRR